MWVFLKDAFLTVVENQSKDAPPNTVIVRARVKSDMETFIKRYVPPSLGKTLEIVFHQNYDYPYRVIMTKMDYGQALAQAAQDIDYRKYKDSAREHLGDSRFSLYSRIWSLLIGMEEDKNRISHYFNRHRADEVRDKPFNDNKEPEIDPDGIKLSGYNDDDPPFGDFRGFGRFG